MSLRKPLIVLGLFVVAGILVTIGERDEVVGLSSVLEVWSDFLRDADHVGLRATRITVDQEMAFGADLAGQVIRDTPEQIGQTRYVAAVGRELTNGLRRPTMRYEFHVLQSSQANAFALPGGHVFIFSGMLNLVESEAELAAILGHEISHVDLRHCVERYQYQLAASKIGVGEAGQLAELVHGLVTMGYDSYQEIEADEQAFRLMVWAGYDPSAEIAVFERLGERAGERSRSRADNPAQEVVEAVGEAVESYLRSHPYSGERARRLAGLIDRNRRHLIQQRFYRGVRNRRLQVPRSERQFSSEWVEGTAVVSRSPR